MSVCDVRGEDLSAFVDSELGILEHRAIESHLATCDACTTTVRAWKRLGTLFEPFIDEPITFTPPIRVPQYLRTALVASVLLLFVIGAVLVGSLTGGTQPGQLASPGVPIPSSSEPAPNRTRAPMPTKPPTPRPPEPAPTEAASEQITGNGQRGPLAADLTIDAPVNAGGTIEVAARLRTTQTEPVTFDAPIESVFDVVIRDVDGIEVMRRSVVEAWSGDTMTRTIRADEEITEAIVVAAPEVPGEYTITLELPVEPASFFTIPSPDPGSESESVEAFATEPVTFTVP